MFGKRTQDHIRERATHPAAEAFIDGLEGLSKDFIASTPDMERHLMSCLAEVIAERLGDGQELVEVVQEEGRIDIYLKVGALSTLVLAGIYAGRLHDQWKIPADPAPVFVVSEE